jgi:GNAT superfamily N-acetyltransferase
VYDPTDPVGRLLFNVLAMVAEFESYLRGPHLRHWMAFIDGAPAGLLSLDVPPGGEVEVDTFGLLPDHTGQGIGSHFLTVGVRLAWAATPAVSRVWLHTSSSATTAMPCPTTKGVGSIAIN